MVVIPQNINPQPMTETKYLAFERASAIKHELVDGKLFESLAKSPVHAEFV